MEWFVLAAVAWLATRWARWADERDAEVQRHERQRRYRQRWIHDHGLGPHVHRHDGPHVHATTALGDTAPVYVGGYAHLQNWG